MEQVMAQTKTAGLSDCDAYLALLKVAVVDFD
jgi:hypothetical protein